MANRYMPVSASVTWPDHERWGGRSGPFSIGGHNRALLRIDARLLRVNGWLRVVPVPSGRGAEVRAGLFIAGRYADVTAARWGRGAYGFGVALRTLEGPVRKHRRRVVLGRRALMLVRGGGSERSIYVETCGGLDVGVTEWQRQHAVVSA